MNSATGARAALTRLLGSSAVLPEVPREYLHDATESQGVVGQADAVVLPETAEQVARVLAWCDAHDVPVVPRGGGTGFAGGSVPLEGGVVLSLGRLRRTRSFDPLLWRICVEAGVTTADLRRTVRQSGLLFPPDPGAAEQSQIGGNIATNAGGPHAFKYGVTGHWVTGLEIVVPPGELLVLGGGVRKDVSGYDLTSLLVGSEGTLGVITAAWLRLVPAPEAALPVAAFYPATAAGCAAIERVLGSGLVPAALEYLDAGTLRLARPSFPVSVPAEAGFLVLAEADGAEEEATRLLAELRSVLAEDSVALFTPSRPQEAAALWRWRDGVSLAVTAARGGKVSEDIVVPLDRLAEAIDGTVAIGRSHGLEALSWGHAGDGNLHSTFLVDPHEGVEVERARGAAAELLRLALALGGSISGEHGIGSVKRAALPDALGARRLEIQAEIKRAFDPKNLLNPGKKH